MAPTTFARSKSIRLTRARTADNLETDPITGELLNSSAPLMRTTFSDLKNRDARQALRQQFSSAFIDNAEPLDDEPTSPIPASAVTETSSTNSFLHPESNLRGNLPRSRTAPTLSATPMPTIVEPSRLATVAEGPSQLDVEQAINLLEQLKKTASPEQLVALHRALLPTKDVITPVTPMFPADALDIPGPAPRSRQSALGVPGLATRPSDDDDVLRKPSSEFLLKPVPATARRRNRRGDGDKSRGGGGLYSPDFFRLPTMHEVTRSDTPELISPAPGAFQYGSLRITNGETPASPDPSRQLPTQLAQRPLAQPPHSPASIDSAMTPETPVDPYTPGADNRSRSASRDEQSAMDASIAQKLQEEERQWNANAAAQQLSREEEHRWQGERVQGGSTDSQRQSPSRSLPRDRSISPQPQRFPRSRLDRQSDSRHGSDSAPVSPMHPHEMNFPNEGSENQPPQVQNSMLAFRQSLRSELPLQAAVATNNLASYADRPLNSASYLSDSRGPGTPLTPMSISTVGESVDGTEYGEAEIIHRDARTVALSRLTGAMVVRPSMLLQQSQVPASPSPSDSSANEPKSLRSTATEATRQSFTRQQAPSASDSGYSSYEMSFPNERKDSESAPRSPGGLRSDDNTTPTLPRLQPADPTNAALVIAPASASTTQHKYRSSIADDQRKSFKDFLTAPPGAPTPALAPSAPSSQTSPTALNDNLSITSDASTQDSNFGDRRKLQKPMPLSVIRKQREEQEKADAAAREAAALEPAAPPAGAVASLNRHSRLFEQQLQDSSRVVVNGSEMSFAPVALPSNDHNIVIPAEPPHKDTYSNHSKSVSSSTTATTATTASSKTARGINGKASRGRKSDASSKTTATTATTGRDYSPHDASDSAGDRKGGSSSWSFARLRSKSRARQAAEAEAKRADAAAAAASFPSLPNLDKYNDAESLPRPEFVVRDRTDSTGSGKSGNSARDRLPWNRKDTNALPANAATSSTTDQNAQNNSSSSQSAVRPRTAGSQYPPTLSLNLSGDAVRSTTSFDHTSQHRPIQRPQEQQRSNSNLSASEMLDRTLTVGASRDIAPPLPSPLFPPADPRLRSTASMMNGGYSAFQDRSGMWPSTPGPQPTSQRNVTNDSGRPKTSHAEDASSSRIRREGGGRPRGPSSPAPAPVPTLEDFPVVSAKVLEAKRLLQQRRAEEDKQARDHAAAGRNAPENSLSPVAGLGIGYDALSASTSPVLAALRTSMDDRRDHVRNMDSAKADTPVEFSSLDGSVTSTGKPRGKGGWEAQVKMMRKKNLEALGVGVDGDANEDGAQLRRVDTGSSMGTTTASIPKSATMPSLPSTTNTAAAAAKTQNMMMLMNLSDDSHRRQREYTPASVLSSSSPSTQLSASPLPNSLQLGQEIALSFPMTPLHRPTTSSTTGSTPADELSEISAQFPQPPPANSNRIMAQSTYLALSNGGGLRAHPPSPLPLSMQPDRLPLDFPQHQAKPAPQQQQPPPQQQQRQHQQKYSYDSRFDETPSSHSEKGTMTSSTFVTVQSGNADRGDPRTQHYQQQQHRGQPVRADSAQSSTSSATTSSAFSNTSGTTSRTTMNSSASAAGGNNSTGYNHFHTNSNATTNSNNYNSHQGPHHTHTTSNRSLGNNNSNNYVPPPSLAAPIPSSPQSTNVANSSSYQADRFRAKVAAKTSAAALMIRSAHHPAPLPPPAFAAPSPPGGPHARAKVPLLAEQLARSGLPPVVTNLGSFGSNNNGMSGPSSSSISPLGSSPLGMTMERERQQQSQTSQPFQNGTQRFAPTAPVSRHQHQPSIDDLAASASSANDHAGPGPMTTASMASAATAALAMDHRFSGGFQYGWDREQGFTGSAGTSSPTKVSAGPTTTGQRHGRGESRDARGEAKMTGLPANRRSVVMSDGFGVDLTDVPVFLRRVER